MVIFQNKIVMPFMLFPKRTCNNAPFRKKIKILTLERWQPWHQSRCDVLDVAQGEPQRQ